MKKITLLVLTTIFVVSLSTDVPCIGYIHNSKDHITFAYDLTPLWHGSGSTDWLYYRDASGNYFYFNFCGPTSSSCNGPSSVCQRASNYRYYSAGSTYTQQFLPLENVPSGTGITVVYSSGDMLTIGYNRSTTISIICSPTANPGFVEDVSESQGEYFVKIRSISGCGVQA